MMPIPEITARAEEFKVKPPEQSKMLINATMKWDYPPLSLPKKEFMENAVKIWQELKLPPLQLRQPWWGIKYGIWTDEEENMANLGTQGKWELVGEMLAKRRKVIE
jgi:4-hydroxy-3-polyprenylbenzoate decarboxylase